MVSIHACHACDPGSIPGQEDFFVPFLPLESCPGIHPRRSHRRGSFLCQLSSSSSYHLPLLVRAGNPTPISTRRRATWQVLLSTTSLIWLLAPPDITNRLQGDIEDLEETVDWWMPQRRRRPPSPAPKFLGPQVFSHSSPGTGETHTLCSARRHAIQELAGGRDGSERLQRAKALGRRLGDEAEWGQSELHRADSTVKEIF